MMRQVTVRVEEGELLVEVLKKRIAESGIKEGVIISMIGALSSFTLITIRQDSETVPPEHFERNFDSKAEIIGNGVIHNGKPHIHLVCGLENGPAFAGHLVEGRVTYFAEITVLAG